MSSPRTVLLLLAVFAAASSVQAQDRLLTPAAFLGYELGTRFTPHHRVIDYAEHVAAHSPNVRLEHYGETYEGRPLVVLYIASPENLSRLETIRMDNLRRAGLLPGEPSGPGPAIVWLSYNVHGNEAVSTEAALATLYDLADPGNARTQAWLAETVIILDPCLNPDGRERYVQWYTSVAGTTPDPRPEAREHNEPWPGGRYNHYYFDLNRDWAWATQAETQQRLSLYHRWMPHLHVDFHEQYYNEPYYFAPAAEPMHEAITPWQRAFQTTIGRNHARYFDEAGWLYFTRERFDLFYPGYGDTWPIFNGAIGMTYEQGGHSRAGLAIETEEGDTLTLADRIAHHHTTGLSTIEATAQHSRQVVEEFARFHREGRAGHAGAYQAFVVKTAKSPGVGAALAAHLDAQGIAYGYAGRSRTVRGFRYRTGDTGTFDVEPGDLVVSLDQPRAVLARVLLEPRSALSDSLTYDITAWALPYVYGLDAVALTERLTPDASAPPAVPTPALPERPYAYLAPWQSTADLRFLASVLQQNVKLRFAAKPFEVDGRTYAPGTLVLTRTSNGHLGDRFDTIVRQTAEALGQPLYAATSGFVTRGADFGSADVPFLDFTRIAVLAGDPVSPMALGEVWHFFDQQIRYPVTLLDARTFEVADLYDYDVLILPSGSYGRVLTDERLTELRAWIRNGGRVVAMGRAVGALAGKDGFAVKEKKPEDAALDSLQFRLQTFGDRERRALSADVPGAVYRVRLDPTHPLAFGYEEDYFTLKESSAAYEFLREGWNVGVIRADAPESGFAGHLARNRLKDSLVFGVQEMGAGEVVYLIDDPLFRGFWEGGKLLFGNAVFLVGR